MKRSLPLFVTILFLFVVLPSVALAQGDRLSSEQVDAIAQSVVLIEALSDDDSVIAAGSGLIVSASGFIYTNRHVVEDADDLVIYMLDDLNEQPLLRYYAKVVSVFELDFAILQIDRNERGNPIDPVLLDLPFVRPEETDVVRGDSIFIFGYPGIGDNYLVLTQGTITTIQNGTVGEDRIPVWYQTDAEIAPGNSGGVAVNIEGKVVGIPTLIAAEGVTGGRLGGILPLVAIRAAVEAGPTVTENTGTDATNEPTPTNPDTAGVDGEDVGGVAITCTGTNASFSNGVEVVITQMRSGFTYTATVIGLNGFDPVLAVLNQPGRGVCDNDTQGVRYYEAFLPTTGAVPRSNQTAQISFSQNTGQVFGNVSLVVGGFGDTAGEFLLILEGMAVTEGDNLGDIFAVRLTPGMVGQATPISVYMVGIATSLDPYFYLADPATYRPLALDGGLVVQCDDAGGDNCFVGSSSLIGSSVSRTERRTANSDRQDAMLVIPIDGFELDTTTPMYLNFVMSSFEDSSFGNYLIAFHMGTR